MEKRFTPEKIQSLRPGEIFVFGSNLQGQHLGGAARIAFEKFGAVWGVGAGLQGQSYAIPTMQGDADTIRPYVDQFVMIARLVPQYTFYVTRIGCGIAGFTDEQIAPLFKDAFGLPNVILPERFHQIINTMLRHESEVEGVRFVSRKIRYYPVDEEKMAKMTMEEKKEYIRTLRKAGRYIYEDD